MRNAARALRKPERALLAAATVVSGAGIVAVSVRPPAVSIRSVRIHASELPSQFGDAEPEPDPAGPVDPCRPSAVLTRDVAEDAVAAVHRAESPLRDVSWTVLVVESEDRAARLMTSLRERLGSCQGFDTPTTDGTLRFEYAIKDLDDPLERDSLYLVSRTITGSRIDVQSHGYVARRGRVIVNMRAASLGRADYPAMDTRLARCVVELLLDRAHEDSDQVGCADAESSVL